MGVCTIISKHSFSSKAKINISDFFSLLRVRKLLQDRHSIRKEKNQKMLKLVFEANSEVSLKLYWQNYFWQLANGKSDSTAS